MRAASTATHAYDESMKRRITVSLPADLVEAAELAVQVGEAPSVSAYVANALRAWSGTDDLAAIVRDMEAEFGKPDEEAEAWARKVLGL